jgi:RNA polymerase sigma-70 factor (ECF subfamily)
VREARTVPYAALAGPDDEAAVEPERFRGPGDPYPGGWWAFPEDWTRLPEQALLQRETLAVVTEAIEQLPALQRSVIAMRDIQGCGPEDVCAVLEISDGNQRVLLHRARSRVRAALERHLDDGA